MQLVGILIDPDTMYMDQALKAPDKKEFLKAMQKEVEAHMEKKHWELVLQLDVPDGTKVLPGPSNSC